MKLVWCPETATKAFIDAVNTAEGREAEAELVAAMAGGWKVQLIVEAWEREDGGATSHGVSLAVRHTGGRHVCVVPDERAAEEYGGCAAEVVVGEAEEAMRELEGVDMVVVDWRRRDAERIVREARPGAMGMVVVCRSVDEGSRTPSAAAAADGRRRLVRSVYLPVGGGMEILHVGVGKGSSIGDGSGAKRWVRHVDRRTGEEHVFRRY
ncbi:hypothetical protein HPP92_021784 [Vanilla planifolia]|uniref:Uncharacterized protein n=1 Tax=Vanilla planifolia TaxID=51239 RepID=A0A835PUI3_VANPL|nr:hypothetical protein HPP92_022095 [Vanilla planifolia]KAG0458656.1 hypothetical protein HPP92_021784 [Vanilla planifolia]